MKVLLSAYACAPNRGSEPEVGFRAMLAAARRHEVWVLTQPQMVAALRQALAGHPAAERIHLEAVEPPSPPHRAGLRGFAEYHWRHDQWQRRAGARAVALDRHIGFDVVHHATLAAYWMRTGVGVVDKPLVWGPIGGSVESPWRLLGELGMRGLVEEAVRTSVRRIAGSMFSPRFTSRAAVVFAQNSATARRLRSRAETIILPAALGVDIPATPAAGPRTKDIAFVGRLIPLKAGRLAVRTMRYVLHPKALLHVYGDGDERRSILTATRRWGIEDRVIFEAQMPRPQLLARIATTGVLLHPSLHDEAPLSVAEALSLGTPLVCLNHGGPAELAQQWPDTPSTRVDPRWPEATARVLAAAVDHHLQSPPPVLRSPRGPRDSYGDRILDAYERAAG
jgi:glycosyltransferase involved in cell wall biosynthesis